MTAVNEGDVAGIGVETGFVDDFDALNPLVESDRALGKGEANARNKRCHRVVISNEQTRQEKQSSDLRVSGEELAPQEP